MKRPIFLFPLGQEEISCAGAVAYAPNGKKLAIATADRHVLLFDEKFRRRDKFATKPVDAKVFECFFKILIRKK